MKVITSTKAFFCVFLGSILYWGYLAYSSRMEISCDAIGYEALGKLLMTKGFIPAYFEHDVNREVIYPLIISIAMHIERLMAFPYTKIMAIYGVSMLCLTQILIYRHLKLLNIRPQVSLAVLIYFALSPAINNTAFSLYSEIAVYPFILGISLISLQIMRHISSGWSMPVILWSSLLGLCFTALTLIKAVFEVIAPLYTAALIIIILLTMKKSKTPNVLPIGLAVLSFLLFFFVPILQYKGLNKTYNGHFAITNRASWALYGNTARRMEPLDTKRLLSALAYAPGEGLCTAFFSPKECSFWSFTKSDEFGMTKNNELLSKYGAGEKIEKELVHLSVEKVLSNPVQYTFLNTVEGIKMFFWESTQIGFVAYPKWLANIYDNAFIKNMLRLIISLMTLISIVIVWFHCLSRKAPMELLPLNLLILLYITAYSFFFILTRYALPIAPLFLICIAYTINFVYNSSHAKNNRPV